MSHTTILALLHRANSALAEKFAILYWSNPHKTGAVMLRYYYKVHSQAMTTLSPFEMPCLEQQGSVQNLDELKRLKKFFCISQCMGGFGGEVNFCKTDGICPAEAGAYMEPLPDKAIIAQDLPQTKGPAAPVTTAKASAPGTTKKPFFQPPKLG